MIESEEKHYKECKLDPEECERCFWITEAKHALSEAGMVIRKAENLLKEIGKVVPRSTNKNNTPLYDLIMEKFKGETIK